MMKKAIIGAFMVASALMPLAASAQMAATMPVLYNSTGQVVNSGNTTALGAGYYFLNANGTSQVYYYGNGTYYNAATGEYGGSVSNPLGTSGASLGYVNNTSVVTGTTYPGVPNTGVGGEAAATWTTLALSGLIVLLGSTYLVATRKNAHR